nr:retrovirus-related Pol polyprotein from transposon TNT 1-94 [Tanacetum cinerariifolium]
NLSAKKVVITPKNNVKKVRYAEPVTSSSNIKQVESSKTSDFNTHVLSPIGLKCSTGNFGSKHTCNKKNVRISQIPSRNIKNKVEAQPRNVNKKNHVVEAIHNVDVNHLKLNANFELICATCKKSMLDGLKCSTGNFGSKHTCNKKNVRISQIPSRNIKNKVEAQPRNVNKKNHVVEAIHNVDVNHLKLNANFELICATCKKSMLDGYPDCSMVSGLWMFKTHDMEPFLAHELFRHVRTDNGIEFVNQTLRVFYENVGISHQTSVACTPQQNGIVERQNWTLIEAARTILIFSKALLFLWAEAINTLCYTKNCSLIRIQYNKTPYELMQDKKLDLSFFHAFGALYYPTNDNDDLGKLDVKADIVLVVAAPRAVDLSDSFVSTSIDQDALSTRIPSTQEQEHSLNISQGFEESPKTPTFRDDPLHESLHEDPTS